LVARIEITAVSAPVAVRTIRAAHAGLVKGSEHGEGRLVLGNLLARPERDPTVKHYGGHRALPHFTE
jgi:hypothetical protein